MVYNDQVSVAMMAMFCGDSLVTPGGASQPLVLTAYLTGNITTITLTSQSDRPLLPG